MIIRFSFNKKYETVLVTIIIEALRIIQKDKDKRVNKVLGKYCVVRWWAFVSVGVGEFQLENSFVCFGAKPTQRACARVFQGNRKKTRKGKIPEQKRVELATVRGRQRSDSGSC